MFRLVGRAPLSLALPILLSAMPHPAPAQGQQAVPVGNRIAPGPFAVVVQGAADQKPIAGALVHLGGRFQATPGSGRVVFDGVPAGDYQLRVDHPTAQRLLKNVTLPLGQRQPLTVALTPAPVVDVKGSVRLAGSDQPVPGARIALQPQAVAASVQGSFSFVADWEGEFEVLDVPGGTYQALLRMPGCEDRQIEVQVGPNMEPLKFELQRIAEPADLQVTLRDSVSGQPLVGAKVILAEAWPLGAIATAPSGPDGRAIFPGLQLGRLNWADPDGKLAVARRHATVRIEKDGYEDVVHLVSLRAGATASFDVNPESDIPEQEPNGDLSAAQPICTGAPVRFTIGTAGDRDVFALRLDEPAHLRIEVGPKNPIQTHIAVLNGQGQRVTENGAHSNQTNVIARGFPAGQYYLQITEWSNRNSSDQTLTLTVTRQTAADPLEPNDTPNSARLIRSGEAVRGTILPRTNVDHYRFELPRPGTVRFTMRPHPLQRLVRIRDEAGKNLGEVGAHEKQPLTLQKGLASGRYLVEVHEWGDDKESPQPYWLRFDTIEDDGVEDPRPVQGRVAAVRTLEPGTLVGGSLNPVGDCDLFAVPLPRSGLLRIRARATTQLEVRVLNSAGKPLVSSGVHPRNRLQLLWSAPGATIAYLEVTEWGRDRYSPLPYTLRAHWEPCDELETLGRNDRPDWATPVEPGDVLRGSITPYKDVDFYRFDLDHPGYLELKGSGPTQLHARILNGRQKVLAYRGVHAGATLVLGADVQAGPVFVEVTEWGNDGSNVGDYHLETLVRRAEPPERRPLTEDSIRTLRVGEAQSFAFDHVADRDRFVCDVPQPGKVFFKLRSPTQVELIVFDDRTGKRLTSIGLHGGATGQRVLEAKGPTRYRLELTEWGNDARSAEPGSIVVEQIDRPLMVEKLTAEIEPTDPTQVTFRRQPWKGSEPAAELQIDADGDGRADLAVPAGGTATWRYPTEGTYSAMALLTGTDGQRALQQLWVDARGPRERKGVHVLVHHPLEGQVIEADEPCRVRAISYTGVRVQRVLLSIDGKPMASGYQSPFELKVPWSSLGGGEHELAFTAIDARGDSSTVTRTVRVSEYFGLMPQDDSVLSGDDVRVSWTGPGFGTAKVRFRAQGEAEWREEVGQNAATRRVTLSDLEPGKTYEFQPVGDGEPGPMRRVTRVKGLAFGRSVYGGNVARDYDQRLAISVRNHGEEPQTVRLQCGKPQSERMLVGFVGDGSEGAPFELAPGEEREFMLGISAQDVISEDHSFPVRIASESGFTDEASVELHVRLPEVKLEWTELGATEDGLGKRYRLHNQGDPITDLQLSAGGDDVMISPAIEHGSLLAGATQEVVVRPKLREGFQRAETELIARTLDKSAAKPVELALEEGDSLYPVDLVPGYGPDGKATDEEAELLAARALSGFYLDPSYVDWSRRDHPEDTNGDGRSDRWSIKDELEGILWVGDDTSGDGEIDFVHADVWWDGQFDYSAFKTEDGWEQTNLVEAWLEMGFSLPWARKQYEKHDVDLVMNQQVIGSLRDQVPEGNYSFKLPSSALQFTDEGLPAQNAVEIRSKHLRGGHYVVGSDFGLKMRMTGTRVWTAAASEEEALSRAFGLDGLSVDQPDFSVSSGEMRLSGPENPKKGDVLELSVPIRNLGAVGTHDVAVALVRGEPGGKGVELARQYVEDIPLVGEKMVTFEWQAGAGNHALRVVVDPDDEARDWSRSNNEAIVSLQVAGDDAPPTLTLEGIEPEQVLTDSVFSLQARGEDDAGIARMEAAIDNGLWRTLRGADNLRSVKGLLQPGKHTISVRATDGSGNQVRQDLPVKVDVPQPEAEFLEPDDGATIDGLQTPVRLKTGPRAKKAMVRANGGPWIQAPIQDGIASASVPVRFGKGHIEAMVVDDRGVRRNLGRKINGTAQPMPGAADDFRPDYVVDDPFHIDGLGDIDLIEDPDFIFDDDPREPRGEEPPQPEAPEGQEPGGATDTEPVPDASGAAADTGTGVNRAPARRPPAAPAPTYAPRRPSGGLVAAQRRQTSRYCTNNPNIKVPFRLPDWLLRKNLPKPGSYEFERMIDKLIGQLWAQGVDTKALERFQEYLEKKCMQLEGPRDLPGWLESVGLSRGEKVDRDARDAWRRQMLDKTRAWWLRLLASGDPDLIAAGLRARMDGFRKFDEGLQGNAQAAIDMISARQTLIEDLAEGLPVAGEMMDLYAVATGRRILNGKEISTLERVIRAGGLVAPKLLEQLFKRSKLAQKGAVYVAEKLSVMGKWGKGNLAKVTGIGIDKIDTFLAKTQKVLTTEISLNKWRMARQAEAAGKAFSKTADGIADLARHADDLDEARRVLAQLGETADDLDFEKAVLEGFQTNKTAQRIINSDAATDELRRRVNQSLRSVYTDVDRAAKSRIQRMLGASDDQLRRLANEAGSNFDELKRFRDKIEDLARRNNVDPANLRVKADDFSGNAGTKVGRDRDVTFSIFDSSTGKHIDDVHHGVSKNIYEQELWLRAHPGQSLPSASQVSRYAEEIDQMVTSRWHPEAYNSGEVGFADFLSSGKTPTVSRLDDIRDTIAIKSEHWWHMAGREANPIRQSQQIAEGMRQATKQWDRIIDPRVTKYMNSSSVAKNLKVPTDLQVGLDIFRKVETGQITVRQADEMLKRIGTSKEGVLKKMTGFFEGMEKDVGRQFRNVGAGQLEQILKQNRHVPGTQEWAGEALGQINDALKTGNISGDVFMRQRASVMSQMQERFLDGDKTAAAFSALESWVARALTDRRISRLEARALREFADQHR